MLTSYSELRAWKNFGKKSINELKEIVLSLCLTGSYSPYNEEDKPIVIDYSSYENMVSSFIAVCVKKKRNQELFKKKLCFQTEKIPTLEELGQSFGITRERVRQIVKKGIRKFKHRVNMDKLEHFWERIDRTVANGGGVIHLEALPSALQEKFNWPTAPYPLALGQLLNLRGADDGNKDFNDLIAADCDCPYCEKVLERINDLDFTEIESYHVEVLSLKLKDYCHAHCPNQEKVNTFHRAFIENLVDRTCGKLILHEDIVMPHKKWLEKYSNKLEDVICNLLDDNGKPMHFSKIANQVRKQNINFQELSDHNVHASIARYDKIKIASRGTYGLKSWELKTYRSVSTAIEAFIDKKGLPQRRHQIIQHLGNEFAEGNITAALSTETRFKSIGDGIYDRQQNWEKRTLESLIAFLPDPVGEFAQYLTGRNNTSYKLVMAFIFIRSMDEHGAIYLFKLKDMFYNFYLSRHKKGLLIETGNAVMNRIEELSKIKIKNQACKRPLESFLKSHYFVRYSQNGRKIKLVNRIFSKLGSPSARDGLLIVILKAIDNYFQMISPETITYVQKTKPSSKERESVFEENSLFPAEPMNKAATTLNIKKKKRGKIRL
ncbi:MAG: sigma factor-like helix-turn-helix DNA-binding protein [Desulfobacula sp.]|nr:sigma factor-like helix-turn-helix DNA-binding protein [Desulfobacula sp.]